MADVFSQIYVQMVFAVKNRRALICLEWEERLHRCITSVVQSRGHNMLVIGGMPEHVHILILKPVEALSEPVREIKNAANDFTKEEHHKSRTFEEEYIEILKDFEVEMWRKKMVDFFLSNG